MAVEGLLEGERRMSTARRAWPCQMAKTLAVTGPDGEQSNGARGFSRFAVSQVHLCARRSIVPRGGERARSRQHALGLGWPGGTPHGQGPPPSSYKTPPKNLYDPKTRRAYT